jgi:aminopeptidase N
MNEGAGKNLNWFWEKWFFGNSVPELSISSAKKSGKKLSITVANKGGKPVPVDLSIYYTDGTKTTVHRSIEAWEKGNAAVTISVLTTKTATKLTLGDPHTPDTNPSDNTFEWQ